MNNLKSFLIVSNKKKDVVPFLEVLDKQMAFHGDPGVNMLKDAIYISVVTLKYLLKTLPRNVMFTLCSKKQKVLHTTVRKKYYPWSINHLSLVP